MRIENIEMLLDTLGIFERGVYEIGDKQISVKLSKEEREKIRVFLPEELEKIRVSPDKMSHFHEARKIEFKCVNKDSFSVAREMNEQKVLVLNLANPVHPGGRCAQRSESTGRRSLPQEFAVVFAGIGGGFAVLYLQ